MTISGKKLYTSKAGCGSDPSIWGLSSAGRASALQAEGHRFEPYRPHRPGGIAQLARARGSYPRCRWFKSNFRYEAEYSSKDGYSFFVCFALFLISLEDFMESEPSNPLFVLSNTCGIYGATTMLYQNMLKDFSEMTESDLVIFLQSVQ